MHVIYFVIDVLKSQLPLCCLCSIFNEDFYQWNESGEIIGHFLRKSESWKENEKALDQPCDGL